MKKSKLPHFYPDIRVNGEIDDETVQDFLEQLDKAIEKDGPIVFELTTVGGNADAGRRIACDIKLCSKLHNKEIYFFGKTVVYSIGAVIMGAFPKEKRFLSPDTRIMIHERRIDKKVHFDNALSSCIQSAQELLSQFETGYQVAKEDFAEIAKGSNIDADEILNRAKCNWYLTAKEALELGLIEGIV